MKKTKENINDFTNIIESKNIGSCLKELQKIFQDLIENNSIYEEGWFKINALLKTIQNIELKDKGILFDVKNNLLLGKEFKILKKINNLPEILVFLSNKFSELKIDKTKIYNNNDFYNKPINEIKETKLELMSDIINYYLSVSVFDSIKNKYDDEDIELNETEKFKILNVLKNSFKKILNNIDLINEKFSFEIIDKIDNKVETKNIIDFDFDKYFLILNKLIYLEDKNNIKSVQLELKDYILNHKENITLLTEEYKLILNIEKDKSPSNPYLNNLSKNSTNNDKSIKIELNK